LYGTEPVFRAAVDRCAGILAAQGALDVRALLYGEGTAEARGQCLQRPRARSWACSS